MKRTVLDNHIKTAPRTPGVYTWRDARGRALYIGKAAHLKSRLSQYRKTADSRIGMMVGEAASLDWQTTDTDIEALILESRLIKRFRPKYNIVMRDDKQYFYVVVTDDEFPKIIVTHQPSGRKAIGPFTEGLPLKTTLRILRRLYPYCTCTQKHYVRCLNAHIDKCPGFCCLKTPASQRQVLEYRTHIRAITGILSGRRPSLIKRLVADSPEFARRIRRAFENARIIRHTGDRVPARIEGYDIATISGQHATGAMVVFSHGEPDKDQYRKFNIRGDVQGDVPMLRQVLERRLAHAEWPLPDLVVVDGGKAQLNAVRSAMKGIPVIAVTKDDRHRPASILTSDAPSPTPLAKVPRALANLVVHIDSEAHRFAISHYRHRHTRALVTD